MEIGVCVCVVIEGMYTFRTGMFGKDLLCVMFVLLYRVCTRSLS